MIGAHGRHHDGYGDHAAEPAARGIIQLPRGGRGIVMSDAAKGTVTA